MAFFKYYHYFIFFFLLAAGHDDECRVSKCTNHGPPIRFPFWLKDKQPDHCGYSGLELSCNERRQTVIKLPVNVSMVVDKIDYKSQKIYLTDPHKCLPKQLLRLNISVSKFTYSTPSQYTDDYALFNCSAPARSSYISIPCLSTPIGYQVYAVRQSFHISDLTYCTRIHGILSIPETIFSNQENFWLAWEKPDCSECESKGKICSSRIYKNATESPKFHLQCLQPEPETGLKKKLLIAGIVLGTVLLFVMLVTLYRAYTSYITRKEDQRKINKFLEDYKAMKPTRYAFADIKKITNQFKEKLGEGAYGSVFKGKLSSEIFVAVKVLSGPTGNGDDFINEVKTMGTIHHVNIVRLVGFCADGSKRALVYEFLPNESLEKFIFSESKKRSSLGWDKLEEIAIGTAKGIEYLHQGCDQRILHFDIKPHNVLLDQNFVPKIADFGQAKLCSKDQSIVSMTAARGTVGYIAPEVFSRNFGNVSYKSDVYSFGMLLLEMVGGRKNNEDAVQKQNPNQAYFPEWIYNRLVSQEDGKEIWLAENENEVIAKKLTIVGLWCIQMHPIDRPSMKTVVQMLEGKGDAMTIPPNPFASSIQNRISTRPPATAFNIELEAIAEEE